MAGFLGCILKFCKIRWNEERTFAAVDAPTLTLSALKIIPLTPQSQSRWWSHCRIVWGT